MSQMPFDTFGPVVSSYIHYSLCGISMLLVIANKVNYYSTETQEGMKKAIPGTCQKAD